MTRTVHRVVGILLALLFGVRAETETLVRVIATIPNEGTLQNANTNARGDLILPGDGQVDDRPLMKDVEVIGFISKKGDFFELDKSRLLGSIEPKEDTYAGMIMCRFGNIVVYSDQDCNYFLKPSITEAPVKTEETEVEQSLSKSQKRKNQRKPSQTKRKESPLRRKALRKRANSNRRRNNLNKKQKSKRRKNVKSKSKQENRRRGNRKNSKRKRVNYGDTRSYAQAQPMQFETLNDRRYN